MTDRSWSNPKLGAFLTARLARLDASLSAPSIQLRQPYREAAAVLVSFQPGTLRPFGAIGEPRAAFDQLLEDSIAPFRTAHAQEPVWTLKSDVRRAALESLAARGQLLAALQANPGPSTSPLQTWFEKAMTGSLPDPATQKPDELAYSVQVIEWLDGLVPNLPSLGEVRTLLSRARMMVPFEHLLANGFAGRSAEIDQLRNFVGVRPASTVLGRISRFALDFFASEQQPPLIVWGPGGVGKSTLMAKFVQEHAVVDREIQFPFVYLDFDSGSVGLARSSALAIQFLAQIVNQYPERAAQVARFRRYFDRFLVMPEAGHEPQRRSSTGTGRLTLLESAVISHLGRLVLPLVSGSDGQTRPVLVVLDTFENVQEFSDAKVRKIAAYVAELQSHLPTLRVVVSGRNDVVGAFVDSKGRAAGHLSIADLDEATADVMLTRMGISDPGQRESIRALAGGNPLTLRLVAQRSLKGKLDTSLGERVTARVKRALPAGEVLIQSYYYGRILNDIEDADVQKLASPGLALRYITPEIIAEVLAGPCRLRVESARDAERLFNALQKYAQLVSSDGQALRHRSDVRRMMLKQLDQARPGLVHEINVAAVAYHERQNGLVNRAEETYHRLRLNQTAAELDPRWNPDVADWLRNSLPELPTRAQLYLVRRNIGTEIVGLSKSDLSDRDRAAVVASKVTDLLAHGLVEEAQSLLAKAERTRSPSPLALVNAQLALLLGRWDDAQDQLDEAQRAALDDANTEQLETALLLAVWVALKREDLEIAERLAERADEVLQRMPTRPARLAWLLVLRRRACQTLPKA